MDIRLATLGSAKRHRHRARRSGLLADGSWALALNLLSKTQSVAILISGYLLNGTQGIGLVAVAISASYLSSAFADFGYSSEVSRYVASAPDSEHLRRALRGILPRVPIGVASAIATLLFTAPNDELSVITILSVSGLACAIFTTNVLTAVMYGLGRFRYVSSTIGAVRALSSGFAIIFCVVSQSSTAVVVTFFLAEFVACLYLLANLWRSIGVPAGSGARPIGFRYMSLGIGSITNTITNQSDVLLVALVANPIALGVFGAGSQVSNGIGTLSIAASVPLTVYVARAVAEGKDPGPILKLGLRATSLIGMGAACLAALAFTGAIVLNLVSPQLYKNGALILILASVFAAVPSAVSGVYFGALMGTNRHSYVALGRVSNALITVPMLILFTASAGMLGAGVAVALRDVTIYLVARSMWRRVRGQYAYVIE